MTLRKNYRIVGVLCACALSFAAAGCATNSYNSNGEWQQPRTRDVPFQTVLVVAVLADSQARQMFEQTVAEAISDGSTRGVAAYSLRGQMAATKLSRDMVIAMVESSGADSVLVTKVMDTAAQVAKSREEAIVHVGPTTKVVQNKDATFTRSLTTNYAIEVVPGSAVIKADAVLESLLFEPATGDKLVYRATTRGQFELGIDNRIEQVAYHYALALAKRLRSDQVIR